MQLIQHVCCFSEDANKNSMDTMNRLITCLDTYLNKYRNLSFFGCVFFLSLNITSAPRSGHLFLHNYQYKSYVSVYTESTHMQAVPIESCVYIYIYINGDALQNLKTDQTFTENGSCDFCFFIF